MNFKRIKYKNFKILQEIDLNLNNLTLLTGINSTGKSSLLQGILLIMQNIRGVSKLDLLNGLNLNENYIELGIAKDILCEDALDDKIELSLSTEKNTLSFIMDTRGELNSDLLKCSHFLEGNMKEYEKWNTQNFQYLSAERIGTKTTYEYSVSKIKGGNLGNKGEFAPHYLAEHRNDRLNIEELKHPEAKTETLLENTSKWLREISKGISINSEIMQEIRQIKLSYEYENGKKSYRPQDIGFGITHTLPIVLAILKSKPGDLLIIENPESHLHPSGQIAIAKLCSLASENGVQIILETHSDHFLNGIRVNVKENTIDIENVQIYYFDKEVPNYSIIDIKLDENGKIGNWPSGFFDEFDTQLDKLLW